MPAVQLGALVALALTASAQDRLASADEVAAAGIPPAASMLGGIPPAGSVVMGVLPTPPKKVVLQTKTYGTITVDHAGHLARRTACRSCHGDGPVAKIAFTARQGHDTCRACHVDSKAGPTDCRGCHSLPPKPETVVAAAEAAPSATGPSAPRPDGAGGPAPAAGKAAERGAGSGGSALPAPPPPPAVAMLEPAGATHSAAAGLPAPPPPPAPGEWEDDPDADGPMFRQAVQAGMVVRGGGDQPALIGAGLELISRSGRAVMVHRLESTGGLRTGRTLLLVGGGAVLPVQPRLALMVVGAGGLDALGTDARLLPAAGVRVGLQWTRAIPHVQLLSATVSGISDLTRQHDATGKRIGDVTFSLAIAAGFGLDR